MAVANPLKGGAGEYKSHIGNPTKHCAVDASTSDVDITDSAHLGEPSVAIYVGTAGNIALTDSSGTTVVYKNVPNATYIPGVFVAVVHATTTASDIVGLA